MKKFLIPSFFAAGLISHDEGANASQSIINQINNDPENNAAIMNFKLPFALAGHSSHASHGSHGSHRSSGGSSTPTPKAPKAGNSTSNSGTLPKIVRNSKKYSALVLETQTCLSIYDYYDGALDGMLGAGTKKAISMAQKQNGMTVTGELDMDFLKRCRSSLK